MPQTLSFNLVHVIFSTKNRLPLINNGIVAALHAYLAATSRKLGCECYRAGGIADHVHLAMKLAPTKIPAKVVSEIKTGSSQWMKQQGIRNFAWQRGYGLFSVSPADLTALIQYIDRKEVHHRKRDFKEEMRAFLEIYLGLRPRLNILSRLWRLSLHCERNCPWRNRVRPVCCCLPTTEPRVHCLGWLASRWSSLRIEGRRPAQILSLGQA